MKVVYEDNHLIVVYKEVGEIVQGDKTGDVPLSEKVEEYLRIKGNKPGRAFVGVVHRIDRPTSGVVIFAKTSKALSRLSDMFRQGEVHKKYHAVVCGQPPDDEATLKGWIVRNEAKNKSYIIGEKRGPAGNTQEGAKYAELSYRTMERGERYTLVEIDLKTGRHHQIRCQMAAIGCPVRGDLKYGAPRSNANGGIDLMAYSISFVHPVRHEEVTIVSPYELKIKRPD